MHPVITISCAFTRRWAIERWIENLRSIEHDPALTNLACIVDTDEPFIASRLRKLAEEDGYRRLELRVNEQHHPNEVRVAVRQNRIAEVKNMSKDQLAVCDGDFVIGLEDDTVFEGMQLRRLLQPLIDHQDVGFVEGVQCGRWGVKMIGAWKVDDPKDPKEIWTLMPPQGWGTNEHVDCYQEIDAGGWYGYATRRELYLQCEYYSSTAQPWGPDVNNGLWLRQRGYRCLIDWDTQFLHNDHNMLLGPDEKLTEVVYTKDAITGKWDRHDTDRTG